MTHSLHGRQRWLALIVLCLGVLMIVLDTTIVNVALPSIAADLGFTETSLVWVVNAYMLTFGGCLLLGGRLGDLYGHRKLFLGGITLFTLASLACGMANSQGLLVCARAVQGLGGAIVSAVSLSLIMNLFTEPGERAKAMGVYGFVCAGGGSIGVLLGGLLTNLLSWHWIFLVNLPIGIAVYALCVALLPSARGHAHGERLDVAGAVSVTASLMLAVYAVVNGNEAGWTSLQTLGLLFAALALLAVFLVIEARVQHPLMPLGLFRLRNVATANVVGVLWAAAMFAWFFISALYLQRVLGYRPLQVGLAFLPANLIMAFFSLGPVGAGGDALRSAYSASRRPAGRRVRPCVVRARPGGRQFRSRRDAGHDPARLRRRHRVQSHAARCHERRRPERFGSRVRYRQYVVHDGRRARSRGAGESRRRAQRRDAGIAGCRGGAQQRLSPGVSIRRDFRGVGGRAGWFAAASGAASCRERNTGTRCRAVGAFICPGEQSGGAELVSSIV
ncbi:MFS family permease [Paraburkholderia bryophila]|uniref:MFS family permease n=1 Tax=Paraburkholderia bryophila TaxID=420952 RepID=A0A7Y9W839_9BURK|nr:MFS family permease [Paraburkholderia bryophila]